MRIKLLAGLVSACALACVLVGPASASAATLTLYDGLEEPAANATFPNGTGMTIYTGGLGIWECDGFTLQTDITENAADPVTLQITGGTIDGCFSSPSVSYSEFQSRSGMPTELNVDGTGVLPLRVTETAKNILGTLWTCVREGNLTVAHSEGVVSVEGKLTKVSGSSFCPASFEVEGSLAPPLDEWGIPIVWVVTP